MKAYILTEEEVKNLATGTTRIKDINLPSKQVKTHLVMPNFGMPESAQVLKEFDDAMDKDELDKKYIKPNMIPKPYCGIVGKLIVRQ